MWTRFNWHNTLNRVLSHQFPKMHGMWKPSKRLATPEEGPCSTQSFTWEIRAKDTKITRIRTRNLGRNLGMYIQLPNTAASQITPVVNLNTKSVASCWKFANGRYCISISYRRISLQVIRLFSFVPLMNPAWVKLSCYCHIWYTYLPSYIHWLYRGADKSLARLWKETSYNDQDLWRTNNRNIFLLFVRHTFWYSIVRLVHCSLFPSRVGLRTYQHPGTYSKDNR